MWILRKSLLCTQFMMWSDKNSYFKCEYAKEIVTLHTVCDLIWYRHFKTIILNVNTKKNTKEIKTVTLHTVYDLIW